MQAARSLASSAPARPISNHPEPAAASGLRESPHASDAGDGMPAISPLRPQSDAQRGEPGQTLLDRWLSWGRRHFGLAATRGPSPAARAWPRGLGFAALPEPIVMQLAGYLGPRDISALSRVEPHCRRLLGPMAFCHGIEVRSDRAVTPSNLDAVLRDSDPLQPGPRSEVLVRLGRSICRMPPALWLSAAGSLLRAVERLPVAARPAPLGMVALVMLACDDLLPSGAMQSRRQLYRRVQDALMGLPVSLRVDALSVLLRDLPSQRMAEPPVNHWLAAMVASTLEVEQIWTLRDAARPTFEAPPAFRHADNALRRAIAALPADTPEALLFAFAMPTRAMHTQTVTQHYERFIEFAASHQGSSAALGHIAAARLLPLLPPEDCLLGWDDVLMKLNELPPDLHCWLLEALADALPGLPPELRADYWLVLYTLAMARLRSDGERYIVLRQLCRVQNGIVGEHNIDLVITLINASAVQALPFRLILLPLALVTGEPRVLAWNMVLDHAEALEPEQRNQALPALASTLDRAPDSGAAWDAILAMTLELRVHEQGAALSALANAMVHLPREQVNSALDRLLEAAGRLPRQDRIDLLALLSRLVVESGLWQQVFHAIQALPRLDRPLPLASLADNIERLHTATEMTAAWQRIWEATLALHPNDRLLPLMALDSTRKRLPTRGSWLAEWQWKRQLSALPRADAVWLDRSAFRANP
ncbi:hypothetical protein J5T34_09000 [Cupriavidus gilardii]|uniref:hypothetical protein n=1 Tax=Cupriavidus gilardii TaxID=82541 RepID=UPI001ABE74FA|nr:hypothetical protein [Cupriavidus gilardii]MBO4120873.1 hypothetical protein [Cupriavidus gilardii]